MPGPLAAAFDGLSSTNSCALPELIHASFHAYQDGDARRGAALYRNWYDYRTFARAAGQPQTVKAAMNLRGWRGGHVRAPLLDLDDTQRAALEPIMARLAARDVHDQAHPGPATTESSRHPAELTA
jgi:dihydrodipicolinate synthase/N-acetylneuraminate lyase